MLAEVAAVRQAPGEARRRWFTSDDLDLIVWLDDAGAPASFQLCWRDGARESAFTWRAGGAASHHAVDDGESRPGRHKMTPVLVPDGTPDLDDLRARFVRQSAAIDPAIAALVRDALRAR